MCTLAATKRRYDTHYPTPATQFTDNFVEKKQSTLVFLADTSFFFVVICRIQQSTMRCLHGLVAIYYKDKYLFYAGDSTRGVPPRSE